MRPNESDAVSYSTRKVTNKNFESEKAVVEVARSLYN